jgi:hypothetical protein
MRVVLEKLLRNGNMDIYQISRTEVVCFAFHDDLLFLSWNAGKIMRIIDCMPAESSVFFTPKKNDFIGPGFRHKPIRHHSAIVIAVFEFEEIYGGY